MTGCHFLCTDFIILTNSSHVMMGGLWRWDYDVWGLYRQILIRCMYSSAACLLVLTPFLGSYIATRHNADLRRVRKPIKFPSACRIHFFISNRKYMLLPVKMEKQVLMGDAGHNWLNTSTGNIRYVRFEMDLKSWNFISFQTTLRSFWDAWCGLGIDRKMDAW